MHSRLLRIAGSLALVLLLVGCDAPEKPVVEFCQINAVAQTCFCGPSNSDEVTEHPLAYCDKATAFRPAEWEKVQNYVDLMEEYIKGGCKR